MPLAYRVPGIIEILAQPNDEACWATVFTMMKSWMLRFPVHGRREVTQKVPIGGRKYEQIPCIFPCSQGNPGHETGSQMTASSAS